LIFISPAEKRSPPLFCKVSASTVRLPPDDISEFESVFVIVDAMTEMSDAPLILPPLVITPVMLTDEMPLPPVISAFALLSRAVPSMLNDPPLITPLFVIFPPDSRDTLLFETTLLPVLFTIS
jgi:hypothetical protein